MMLMPRKNFDVFDDFFEDPFFNGHDNRVMKTDIKENDDKFEITVDLPGFEKENIKMHIDDGYLVIEASTNTNNEEKDKKGKFVRKERYYGHCSRSYYIGNEFTEEDIKATFKNGVLNIELPKKDEKKLNNKKYIEIGE